MRAKEDDALAATSIRMGEIPPDSAIRSLLVRSVMGVVGSIGGQDNSTTSPVTGLGPWQEDWVDGRRATLAPARFPSTAHALSGQHFQTLSTDTQIWADSGVCINSVLQRKGRDAVDWWA